VQAYSAALELDESPAGFGNRSIAHLKLKQNTEAIEDARRAVELRPFWAKWHLRLAAALRADGQHEEALGSLLIAAALEYKAGAASLQSGSRVCIHSLQSAAHLNDRKGKCVHWYRDWPLASSVAGWKLYQGEA
jgi:tetratricopeptide (TPR) repeat protein